MHPRLATQEMTIAKTPQPRLLRLWRRRQRQWRRWARRVGFWPKLEVGLSILLLLTAVTSYALLSRQAGSVLPRTGVRLLWLVAINGSLMAGLLLLVLRRLLLLIANRRRGLAGSRLHIRMTQIFAALAIVPTLLVAIYATLLFEFGFSFWFSQNISNILGHADEVARAYVSENRQRIRGDIQGMRQDLGNSLFFAGTAEFQKRLELEVTRRGLDEAIVFHRNDEGPYLDIVASVSSRFGPLQPRLRTEDVQIAALGEIVVLAGDRDENDNIFQAISLFDTNAQYFIYINRQASADVVRQVVQAQNALTEYRHINAERQRLQRRFLVLLAILSIVVLLAAILAALYSADRIVAPIGRLVKAAGRVGRGDLAARVPVRGNGDEFSVLARTFNRMTSELQGQTSALLAVNEQLDARRRFTEAVLSGVSAGVLGVTVEGLITLANRAATELLDRPEEMLRGQYLADALPIMQRLFEEAMNNPLGEAQGSIDIPPPLDAAKDSEPRTLLVKITPEQRTSVHKSGSERGSFPEVVASQGYVISFDDVTEALADQRRAAWADVARRIAHEIKNPLTPIQLSAERIRRKYLREITTDPDVFVACTDTIIRQVNDLRKMVDEFSSFARLPKPVFRAEPLQELVRQATFLQELANPQIKFTSEVPEARIYLTCDRRQITQAVTNLVKNAVEATQAKHEQVADDHQPHIHVCIAVRGAEAMISVADNGVGLPTDKRAQLTEPYVTTRAKGTGLGLAIVKKIVEDHGGKLLLNDNEDGQGAVVTILLPLQAAALGIDDDRAEPTQQPAENL